MVADGQLCASKESDGDRMIRSARVEILISCAARLKVRRNRLGTLKRMPGGVGGTAASAAYPSRLEAV
ncbi:MAG: hypothetical protein DA408_16130, partial [Bacteroidetes bacterium]